MRVLIVGAGNMGQTYSQSFFDANVVSRSNLFFLEKRTDRSDLLEKWSEHPIQTAPGDFIKEMDLVILAVKPQDFGSLADQLRPFLRSDQLIISIMAGITVPRLVKALDVSKVVRAMPNLPAQVGLGMTVFTTSPEVSRLEIFTVQNLLNTTGKTLYVEAEDLLDAATAISGSGPAFVFYVMNAMMIRARDMGFSEAEAKLLVHQTFRGSINLLNRNSLGCEEWIARVSSKGGTTEAAINFFDEKALTSLIGQGLEVAKNRARELSQT
ncbi:MAG: pyrroline-5-carboxylate reductase [Bacteroidota bacterium]